MGNICFGSKPENEKASAFHSSLDRSDGNHHHRHGAVTSAGVDTVVPLKGEYATDATSLSHLQTAGSMTTTTTMTTFEAMNARQNEEELARLALIVQAANRKMVAVQSTRGSNAYYDQGFAAALSQHLEQTTEFPQDSVKRPLPALLLPANEDATQSVYERLTQPVWQGIQVGFHDDDSGMGGLAGESPHAFMDRIAESLLEEMVPKKERLFANVEPMVESLL